MEMFVVDFKGSLIVQADSEELACKTADRWAALLEDKAPKLLMPEVTAVTLRRHKEKDQASKKELKAILAASDKKKKAKKKKP